MSIRVEFYGIPRRRAGVAATTVDARTLGEALARLHHTFPALAEVCEADGRLRPGYLANINAAHFTRDPAYPLCEGDSLLILSSDAGG